MTKQELEAIIAEYAERYDPLITLDEAGAIAHVPLGTIYAWSSAGRLDDFKQPGTTT